MSVFLHWFKTASTQEFWLVTGLLLFAFLFTAAGVILLLDMGSRRK